MLEATAVTRPKRFLTDLGKFSVAPGASSPAAPRVCFGLRDGEYRTMTRTPICNIGILGLTGGALALTAVILRALAKFKSLGGGFWWDDWTIIFTAVCTTLPCIEH